MPDHAKVNKKQRTSYLQDFVRWFQLKKYQYEVTFSLYMLTSTEKLIFNLVLFILISLLVTAAWLYLPNHISIIYNRIWYYLHGEFAYSTTEIGSKNMQMTGLKSTAAAIRTSLSATAPTVAESVGTALREL
ncbi:hypothetical protein LTR10_021517 [Elasticomyces elasticus]|uniref:Serine palmitoyltransferase small subunit B n=1 Tax=Exophiala sideris TaxID=1016849 RepID=A0ABR0J8P6_9EURO|nr:hypothetical protein LTR10_021517 [Elasticomyces elasticus]KAK5027973.1 hypothetical protein LTS07_006849 [Exophiala sideris]KAK5037436.1 hypothetical protein LTR13_004593 [Exophiala sideris]KAK5059098.1 hypothetical protein LTR69_006387 [Exophiala sideris]KAK5182931.1 hypothetical protein LTR44_004641 [Eurotiomycetes sp. CCFEE 6388]